MWHKQCTVDFGIVFIYFCLFNYINCIAILPLITDTVCFKRSGVGLLLVLEHTEHAHCHTHKFSTVHNDGSEYNILVQLYMSCRYPNCYLTFLRGLLDMMIFVETIQKCSL